MVIRKVTVTCAKKECPCAEQPKPDPEKGSFSYFEMSEFGRSGNRNRKLDLDYVWTIGPERKTCGTYHQSAVTKVFCKKDIEKLAGGRLEDWEGVQVFPKDKDVGFWCTTKGGPNTRENLDWFDGATSRDGVNHTRTQTLDWCCCGNPDTNDFFITTSDPKPKK
jgi:hypothetical protein